MGAHLHATTAEFLGLAGRGCRKMSRRGNFAESLPLWARVLVALELAIQRSAIETQHLGGGGLVPTNRLEHTQDVAPLDLLHRQKSGRLYAWSRELARAVVSDLLGQIVHRQLLVSSESDRALDAVLQLTHVAGPPVGEQLFGGRRPDAPDRLSHLGGETAHE